MKVTTVSPSVFGLLHGLTTLTAASKQQMSDVNGWWDLTWTADASKVSYVQRAGYADRPFQPVWMDGVNHRTFTDVSRAIVAELRRQAAVAGDLQVAHHSKAAELRAAAATAPPEEAADLIMAAAIQDDMAERAGGWAEDAAFAGARGDTIITTYDALYRDLNAAVSAAGGDVAEAPSYHRGG